MHLHHIAREYVARNVRRKEEVEDSQHIHEGLNWRDGITISLAILTLGALALWFEHDFKTNGDIIFDSATAIGAHPLHVVYRRLSYVVTDVAGAILGHLL
jgi:hypothetical protein